ncbi:MAG: hypothetical protein KHZ99_03875 [Clostridium sp.]|uniref:hypothetical protein n=1 Tax=Clostridium sp. TaxID=1506 RepID=UPI0025C51E6D|nr:hypothetical protein [Clostridium sp.]MBS4956181.1 hypothetical protein [Clostridium sp.]MDU2489827.1 hypothetical protein [Clostridium celatum]
MSNFNELIPNNSGNFIFIGEAGSGKSEIAINFAIDLAANSNKSIHFFDMDMTKALFRSRDLSEKLINLGIKVHYQEQYMDAPTLVGGVNRLLKDEDSIVIMDIGGDYIGARSIGGFAPLLNKDNTVIYYVLNSLRPWSYDIEHIDGTLSQILKVSHINLDKIKLIDNSNLGIETKEEDYLEGCKKIIETVTQYMPIEFSCVKRELYKTVADKVELPIVPIDLYLTYQWV